MRRLERLSVAQARRIALAAQGFAVPRPSDPGRRHLRQLFERLGAVQMDSVNVLARAHFLAPFSRLGAYDPAVLDDLAYHKRPRELFEYWGHEASLMPVALQPLLRWRMAQAERFDAGWSHVREIARKQPRFIEGVLRQVRERGPIAAGELIEAGKSTGSWWGWSDGKRALEWLFWAGKITTAERRGFERLYDLPERVLPGEILAMPTPPEEEAQRELLRIAARAHGVATERDLRDYFRLSPAESKSRIADLVENGELRPVEVEGWKQQAYLNPSAKIPAKVNARALLSPFDSLIWERARTQRLFDFNYRLEIYTPAHKRVHGYYVLPFLYGDRLVARVDLKSARKDGALDVHYEEHVDANDVVEPLAAELREMADWLDHRHIRVLTRSARARSLRSAISNS
jgi:uncharacterized protein